MDFNIEKTISNFVETQFPQFYLTEGPNFVLFVKAYYEWLESEGQAVNQARNLYDYRDIDNTLTSFLEHFQKKYLYGIPFNVIVNKRFLLKHILDVYRSKGSINCYKLLFKLIYDQDCEIYLPKIDILKPSDGTWVEPKYLEVTNTGNLQEFVGKTIVSSSGITTAVCEGYVKEPVNGNIVNILYISNIQPSGSTFYTGEKILLYLDNSISIDQAPTIIGSLTNLQLLSGGIGFNVGDLLKIAHVDPLTNKIASFGIDGEVRVLETKRQSGGLTFNINNGGSGYKQSSETFVYNNPSDTTGSGGYFSFGPLKDTVTVTYNTDLLINYANTLLGAASYGYPGNTSANSSTAFQNMLSFKTETFGTFQSLTNIFVGNNYSTSPYIFVKSAITSLPLSGNVTYNTGSNNITGTSTTFTTIFSSNDMIFIQANNSNSQTGEYQIIKSVNSDTSITLYGPPQNNSTVSATYSLTPEIFPATFAPYEPIMVRADQTIPGNNAVITALTVTGNDSVYSVTAVDSGKGYVDGEIVNAYLVDGLNTPTIINAGINYSNNDTIVFSGGGYSSPAIGYVLTNSNGNITSVVMLYSGSGYQSAPDASVKSQYGSGGILSATVAGAGQFNTFSRVIGKVIRSGVGIKPGYWSTTKGFLNSNKYIQDSYFYQEIGRAHV